MEDNRWRSFGRKIRKSEILTLPVYQLTTAREKKMIDDICDSLTKNVQAFAESSRVAISEPGRAYVKAGPYKSNIEKPNIENNVAFAVEPGSNQEQIVRETPNPNRDMPVGNIIPFPVQNQGYDNYVNNQAV